METNSLRPSTTTTSREEHLNTQRKPTVGNGRAPRKVNRNPFLSIDDGTDTQAPPSGHNSATAGQPPVIPPEAPNFTVKKNVNNGYSVEDMYSRANQELGSGTFGSVYKGQNINKHTSSCKQCPDVAANKTTPTILGKCKGKLYDNNDIENNCQEVKTLIRLRDRDVRPTTALHLIESFWKYSIDGKGELTIVSGLLGERLDKWRQRQQHCLESSARNISSALIDALHFMHQRGVVHRNLKLQNIWFQCENDLMSLKIVDFEWAKVLDHGKMAKDFCGSLGYISPEIYKGEEYGFEVDMFAMGVIAFRLLSGVRPFVSSNQDKLRHDTVNLRYTVHQTRWKGVSQEAIKLVRKLLIGRQDGIQAEAAIGHEWFRTNKESILPIDYSQTSDYVPDVTYSKAVLHSRAPSGPSSHKDGNGFILDSSLEYTVNLLLSLEYYTARIVNYNGDESSTFIGVEEYVPRNALDLPSYVAQHRVYTEKHCRRICRSIAKIIQVSHENGMAHRNIHMNNLWVNPQTITIFRLTKRKKLFLGAGVVALGIRFVIVLTAVLNKSEPNFVSQSPTPITLQPMMGPPSLPPVLSSPVSQQPVFLPTSSSPSLFPFSLLPTSRPITEKPTGFPVASTTTITTGLLHDGCSGFPVATTHIDSRRGYSNNDTIFDPTLPTCLGELTQLTLGQLTALTELYLHITNQLRGTIPSELQRLTALKGLYLRGNQLRGTIPSWLERLTALDYLELHNQLSGTIPTQLRSLTALTWLDLADNELAGTIPTQLQSLKALTRLDLSRNQLTGAIPTQPGSNILGTLHLSDNQLTGTIPTQLGSLTNMTTLGLSYNQLTGTIPSQLRLLAALNYLYLASNLLTGTIPLWVSDLRKSSLWGNAFDED